MYFRMRVKKVLKSILIGMTMASKIYAYAPPVTNIGRSMITTFTAPPSITFLARGENRIYFNTVLLFGKSDDDDNDDDDDGDSENAVAMGPAATNVLGTTLCSCCSNVGGNSGIGTGYYRNGYCSTGQDDIGRHTVCVQVTDDFLTFSKAVGNDLSTKMPQYLFPGLKDGDIWCLCAERWVQAYEAGMAPKLFLKATHEKTLDYVSFDVLRQYAIDKNEADNIITTLNEQRDRLNKLI